MAWRGQSLTKQALSEQPAQLSLPSNSHPAAAPLQGTGPQVWGEGTAAPRASAQEAKVLLANEEAPERLPKSPGGPENNQVRPESRDCLLPIFSPLCAVGHTLTGVGGWLNLLLHA